MDYSGEDLAPGQVLAGYTVIQLLGAGGMGRVYLVQHPRLPRNQALKVLSPGLAAQPGFKERFRRESDLAARLEHPNIVSVQDAGVDGNLMWIAMQYVPGTDAAAMIQQAPRGLDARLAVRVIEQVAAGLDYAHAHGMLHRDIKPANIMVTTRSDAAVWALIADFGIARSFQEETTLTATGTMIGTLAYTAPEVLDGGPLSPGVDQYALACTLYELLTGQPVFGKRPHAAMMHAHANLAPQPVTALRPDLPPAMDAVFARALSKNPAERFPSCGAFAAAASAALAEPPTVVTPVPRGHQNGYTPTEHVTISGPVPPPTAPPKSNRTAILVATLAAILVVVAAIAAVVLIRGNDNSTTASLSSTAPVTSSTTHGSTTRTTTPPETTSRPAPMIGTWSGPVSGDQSGFDVEATIIATDPLNANVRYPQIGCAGTWREESSNGSTINIHETITSGTCVTSQIVLTQLSDDAIAFHSSYYSASQKRVMTITATLRRN